MSEILQLGKDLYEQTYVDESPNELTVIDKHELQEKYSESSENIKAWTRIGLKRFKESLSLNENQIKAIQNIIGSKQTGIFDANSFYKYAVYIKGRERTLKSILREVQGNDTTRSTLKDSGRRSVEVDSYQTLAYPPKSKAHAREMQNMLKQGGYYNMKIDGNFGRGSRKALQKMLKVRGLYKGAIDGIIGKGSRRALNAFNQRQGLDSAKRGNVSFGKRTPSSVEKREVVLDSQNLRSAIGYIKANLSTPEIQELKKILGLRKNASLQSIAQEVAQYQSQNNLTVDGKPGRRTISSLGMEKSTMYGADIDRDNTTIKSAEKFQGFEKLSKKWQIIFSEFFLVATTRERNEILSRKFPIALADTRTNRGILIMGNKHVEFPVSFSENGLFVKGPSQGDNAVNYGFVEHFTHGRPYKYGGMAVEVRESQQVLAGRPEPSYKWWHAAAGSNKDGLRNTIGCKGLPVNIAQKLSDYVNRAGKGFGYTSRT